MAGNNTLTFNDAEFEKDVLKSDIPVLVDFWAEWCPPCRALAPTVDAIATDNLGKVNVGELNIDENGVTVSRYHVRSIPTLLLFKGGAVVEKHVGTLGKAELQKMLEKHSNGAA